MSFFLLIILSLEGFKVVVVVVIVVVGEGASPERTWQTVQACLSDELSPKRYSKRLS